MWPFKRKAKQSSVVPSDAKFSQLDITERFDDHLSLGLDDWIGTLPLNARMADPEKFGLPALTASADQIYKVASQMSLIRESLPLPNDGVYCPVCHVASINRKLLRLPCPTCGRALLQFGWD